VIQLLQAASQIETEPAAVLEPGLEIADSVMTYRRRFFTAPRWAGVLFLLLCDESNPRSLAFQVNLLDEHAKALMSDSKKPVSPSDYDPASLADVLRSFRLEDLTGQDEEKAAQSLLDHLEAWSNGLAELSDQMTIRYFSHSLPRVSQAP
jgi:uncharacterized alpha-E superfamily protein